MIITTSGAVALAAGSALHSVARAQRPAAVALLAILVAAALLPVCGPARRSNPGTARRQPVATHSRD
jgi:hypothetical protein